MSQKARVALGIVSLGIVAALLPPLSVSAIMSQSSPGLAPNSPMCTIYDATLKVSFNNSVVAEMANQAGLEGNWPAAKKAYLSSFKSDAKLDQQLVSALNKAPHNEKVAEGVITAFEEKLIGIVRKAKGWSQFSSAENAALKSRKLKSAEFTLGNYFLAQCGSPSPTS